MTKNERLVEAVTLVFEMTIQGADGYEIDRALRHACVVNTVVSEYLISSSITNNRIGGLMKKYIHGY